METPNKKNLKRKVSNDVKNYRGLITNALIDAGVKMSVIVEANKKIGFDIDASNLYRQIKKIRFTGSPLSDKKDSGRPSLLTDDQWCVVCGAVLNAEEEVDLVWLSKKIDDLFGVDMDFSTISKHMKKCNMSFKLCGGRYRKIVTSFSDYVDEYYCFVLKLHSDGFFKHDPSKILCFDSCTNSVRLDRRRSYQFKGGKQKKIQALKAVYTNTYLHCVAINNLKVFRPIMFTHDPFFKKDGKNAKQVKELLELWELEPWQIVYEKSSKKYWAEGSDTIGHYKALFRKELQGCRVLHDGGGAFKIKGEYILGDGADILLTFPMESHGELSVLDNKIFAIAKAWWRVERKKMISSKHALYLLYCIDSVKKESIKSMWDQNFFLGEKKLSLATVEDHLRGKKKMKEKKFALYVKYLDAMTKHEKNNQPRRYPTRSQK